MKTKLTLLLLFISTLLIAQQKPTAKDTVPGAVFAQVHMAATFINGKFALDSLSDKFHERYFTIRMSGCIAQQMAFGEIYNTDRCDKIVGELKNYLNIFCPKPNEEYERQLKNTIRLTKRNWQKIVNHANTLMLDEQGAAWALYNM
jgi:hypothetical protein